MARSHCITEFEARERQVCPANPNAKCNACLKQLRQKTERVPERSSKKNEMKRLVQTKTKRTKIKIKKIRSGVVREMATAAEGEDGEMMRRRRRVILQNFYGAAAEAEQQEKQAAAPDPASIDNGAFDPDRYFERLLRSQGVRRLLKTDQSMLRDIKKLDSDMKTLVYENYNKFISATDTIRDMKTNVENMEEEMQRLTANMDTITLVSDNITATLAPRRYPLPPRGTLCGALSRALHARTHTHTHTVHVVVVAGGGGGGGAPRGTTLSQPRARGGVGARARAQGEAARAEWSVPTAEEGTPLLLLRLALAHASLWSRSPPSGGCRLVVCLVSCACACRVV